jgi:hypothetical protein
MSFTGARVADEDDILFLRDKLACGTVIDNSFIDRGLERVVKILQGSEAGEFCSLVALFIVGVLSDKTYLRVNKIFNWYEHTCPTSDNMIFFQYAASKN